MKGKEKNMTEIRQIIHRLRMGQSIRLIHKEFGIHRPLIRELHKLAILHQWLDPQLPMPTDEEIGSVRKQKTKEKNHPLDVHREQLKQWTEEGLSSVVIHQLLKDKCPCDMQAIRRYIKKFFPKAIEPVMVRPTVPCKYMDVDFGELGKFLDDSGKLRKVWLFSARLRHSRKTYREIVFNQTSQTFLMGHVHAFEYFNGVPEICVPDNLKAGVIRSNIDNDMINRSYMELAEFYNFIVSPCLPYTPEHKGGVESDIKYAKKNFLPFFLAKQKERGIITSKVCDLIEALKNWNNEVADVRIIHGVGRSPYEIFKSEEERLLHPLPKNRWEPTSWRQCEVRRDWRVMIESAYYSVPYHLIGKTVNVCITDLFVRIFHEGKEVALHEKTTEQWGYKRKTEHAPPFKEGVLQSTREGLLIMAEEIGPHTYKVAHTILSHPSVDKLKPVRHLLRLVLKYSESRVEKACKRACDYNLFSYGSIKNILESELDLIPTYSSNREKIIPISQPRFARDPSDYKSTEPGFKKPTLEEAQNRVHLLSRLSNKEMNPFTRSMMISIEKDMAKEEKEKLLKAPE